MPQESKFATIHFQEHNAKEEGDRKNAWAAMFLIFTICEFTICEFEQPRDMTTQEAKQQSSSAIN